MCITKIRKHIGFIVFLLLMSLLILPMALFGEKAEGKIERKSEENVGFELTVSRGYVPCVSSGINIYPTHNLNTTKRISFTSNIHVFSFLRSL